MEVLTDTVAPTSVLLLLRRRLLRGGGLTLILQEFALWIAVSKHGLRRLGVLGNQIANMR